MFDVIVSGLGLAGLSAVKALQSNNSLKIAAIEKEDSVGKNIVCAEGIASYLLPLMPFKLPKKAIAWPIKGIQFHSNEFSLKRTGSLWTGFNLNRKVLQEELFKEEKNKIKTFFSHTITEIKEKDSYLELTLNNNKKIQTKYLIAAEGVNSITRKLLYKKDPLIKAQVQSFEFDFLKLKDYFLEQIYFSNASPLGYGYIFPKSKKRANIGIGGLQKIKDINKSYQEFTELDDVKKQLKGAKIIQEKKGEAPLNLLKEINTERILFSGDAANHNLKPFLEGIIPSIISGYLAGKTIKSAKKQEFDAGKEFEKHLNFLIGNLLKESNDLMPLLEKLFENKNGNRDCLLLGFFSNCLNKKELKYLLNSDENKIREKIKENHKKIGLLESLYAFKIQVSSLKKLFVF